MTGVLLRGYFFLNLFLVIVAGILGVELYENLFAPRHVFPDSPVEQALPAEPIEEEAVASAAERGADDYRVIVLKDLFRPERSAPEVVEVTERKSPPPPPVAPPRLIGVVITGRDARAYLEDPETGVARPCRVNDSIAGFTVYGIEAQRVVLRRDGREVEVKLGAKDETERLDGRRSAGRGQARRRKVSPPLYIPPEGLTGSPGREKGM